MLIVETLIGLVQVMLAVTLVHEGVHRVMLWNVGCNIFIGTFMASVLGAMMILTVNRDLLYSIHIAGSVTLVIAVMCVSLLFVIKFIVDLTAKIWSLITKARDDHRKAAAQYAEPGRDDYLNFPPV